MSKKKKKESSGRKSVVLNQEQESEKVKTRDPVKETKKIQEMTIKEKRKNERKAKFHLYVNSFLDILGYAFSELLSFVTALFILTAGVLALNRILTASSYVDVAVIIASCVLILVMARINERIG